ncbi:MAG TPA: c-type cytochrome [Planctomycetes bacterium]|nr:c-type cytochrome [Planctomycetota bacterium]
MADRGDTHYSVPSLNRWFAISSLALLIAALWMVLHDFDRPWKVYQREYQEIEVQRAKAALSTPEAQEAIAEEQRLASEIEEIKRSQAQGGGDLASAEEELILLEDEKAKADARARVAKQEAGWQRFLTDEHRVKHGEDAEYQEMLEELVERERVMMETANALKEITAKVEAKKAEIERLNADLEELETRMKLATKNIALVRKKLEELDPTDPVRRLANLVRDDIPGLDFVGPTLKVRMALPPKLTFELNFTKKPRIDMCQTCHMPIDKEGYTEYEQPFVSHPRQDLYLGSKSPHPIGEFGCTICHRGAGEALTFQRVDHRADDEEQAEEWREKYGWHKQHYWDYPMLPARFVEAGCVQCHKDSLEVIEPDAPKVVEGYKLFERYGCYACHKVDWFPTKRRPGPPLKKVLEKTTPEFIASWVTNPKAFRPTTWMPQIFHLENYSADTEVAISNYGTGRPMMGDEWSDAALASVTAFIQSRSATDPLPEIPLEGDPLRGREVFRLSGCLACHNVAPFTDEERAEVDDLAQELGGTNEHGPNLRGIATKVAPEWLYQWIKDPTAYWEGTRMPNLRLPDQDIADIVAYVFDDPDGFFHDVPEGWEPRLTSYKRDVLEEQARWFFNRMRPEDLEDKFQGPWKADRDLLVAMGERWVLQQGCFSCHEIEGLEDANRIGTELTTWGSKTVDKLDFGFIPEIFAKEAGFEPGSEEEYEAVHEFKAYRENFLQQKLHAPRSFDREKIKNPTERLRMPWFDFTDEEVEALTTFVTGLVEDEVEQARMIPTEQQLAVDTGLRVIRQKNCIACHVLEPGTIEFDDEDGVHHSVKGQMSFFDEDSVFPPSMEHFDRDLANYIADMRDYEEDPEWYPEELYAQLLETDVELGETGTTFAISNVASIRTTPPVGGRFVDLVMRYYVDPWAYNPETDEYDICLTGDPDGEGRIQDVDGEWRDFSEEPFDKLRWTYAPPVLIGEGEKLQRDWFFRFLNDPEVLRPQIRVRMPSFHWEDNEAGAVADYFAAAAEKDWPREYARQLQIQLGLTPAEIAQGIIAELGLSGSSAEQVAGIAEGLPVETAAGLPNLLAFGEAHNFRFHPAVNPIYERIPQRTPAWLKRYFDERPDFYKDVHNLVAGPGGPTCVQCHGLAGRPPTNATPIGWAPDLTLVRERLRPDWVRRWLTDPSKVYPGTTMPANFDLGSEQWQDLYPAPSAEQIEAVTTWLFNLDRALIEN